MQPTRMIPTSLGFGVSMNTGTLPVLPASLALPPDFPLSLGEQQVRDIQARVEKFDFAAKPAQEIALLSKGPTDNLNRALSGFLERISKNENPQIFKLVDALSEEVAKEKLGDLAEQILSAKPSKMDRFKGLFSKKALQEGLDRAYEELGRVARNKSKTLSDSISDKERKLNVEMDKLSDELRNMDAVKAEYRKAFIGFGEEVVFLTSVLAKAKADEPALLAAVGNDMMAKQDIADKLQLLESVALSRASMFTRMPAEALLIRQVQNAGVATLQELSVTTGDQFASIRMTLVGIHGAHMVQGVQRLGQSTAALDSNLQDARAKLMGTVIAEAANAPGRNRLAQANNLQKVVADTKALQGIVDTARVENASNFKQAQAIVSQAQQVLLT